MKLILLFVLAISLALSASAPTYHEKYRPAYHFSPPKNWMNDPNGLIFFGGLYQLYYQYNPYDVVWGHMSWGHAVSLDLVTWKNLPVAIPEYDGIQIFSGCNIIDVNNTSGFCKTKQCLLAYYTAQTAKGEAQAFAYSNDFGVSYTQYSGNPIIDENQTDHRDPKVFWYEPDQKWVMITALSTQFKCRLYSSKDLIHWDHLSDFGPEGSSEGIWEDPDLYALPDDQGNMKWVLAHAVGIAKVEYYIGEFDGTTFTNTETKGVNLFYDYGRDFTEAATFNSDPKGRRLITAWFTDNIYASLVPTGAEGWRGSLTLIRELKLRRYPEGLRVVSQPIDEYSKLRGKNVHYQNLQLNGTFEFLDLNQTCNQLEILAIFALPNDTASMPSEFGLTVFAGVDQWTAIGYNVKENRLFVNRKESGIVDFEPSFPCVTSVTLIPENGMIQLRVFVDQSSVEVFANNGKVAMSNLIFPDPTQNGVYAYVNDGAVTLASLDFWPLSGIWPQAEEDKEFLSQ